LTDRLKRRGHSFPVWYWLTDRLKRWGHLSLQIKSAAQKNRVKLSPVEGFGAGKILEMKQIGLQVASRRSV
jgi:hypothetical protein